MKIGIITFWWSNDNYGQLLQCWALQQQLKSMGHEPFLIRYKPSYKSTLFQKVKKILLVYPIINKILRQQRNKEEKQKALILAEKNKVRNFDCFRKEHLSLSDEVYTTLKELQSNPPIADVYITGSDQVWAHLLDKNDNAAYFLAFGNNAVKRISYAASFSMTQYPVSLRKKLREQLDRFDAVSVREQDGANICNGIGVFSEVVVDPTILLETSCYDQLTSDTHINKPYIYVYSININNPKQICWEELKTYLDKTQMDIIVTPSSGYFPAEEVFPNVQYAYASIPQWLSLIRKAEMVVTTSFHGVVFSVLFHKKFVYFPLEGNLGRGNNRVISLLNKVELLSQIWKFGATYEELASVIINWSRVDKLICTERQYARSFLENYLK